MLWRQNTLLSLLPKDVLELWQPHLNLVALAKGVPFSFSGRDPSLYFPLTCVASMSMRSVDSPQLFLRFTGANFVIGLIDLFKIEPVHFTGVVCGSGYALRISSRFVREQLPPDFLGGEPRGTTMARIAKNGLQSSLCAAHHQSSQRLARLLLQAHECFGPDSDISLTQQELCDLLVVRRETVTSLLSRWHSHGWVDTFRGGIRLKDIAALSDLSCDCLHATRTFYGEELAIWKSIKWRT